METISAKSKTLKEVNSLLRQSLNGSPVKLSGVDQIHGLAAGLSHGEVLVEGNVGDYLAALNAGATIRVSKNAGSYAADNMNSGTIIIEGDAGFGAAEYCYGGIVIIRGNAGDFTATMNKGATIIVQGNVGDEAGTYMLKGDLIIVGNAGENFANYLIRGSVFIGGEYGSLGHNTRLVDMTDEDIARLKAYFEIYQITADPLRFRKIVAASEKPFYH
jgi:glutamate synthase domain-containing protein 3